MCMLASMHAVFLGGTRGVDKCGDGGGGWGGGFFGGGDSREDCGVKNGRALSSKHTSRAAGTPPSSFFVSLSGPQYAQHEPSVAAAGAR